MQPSVKQAAEAIELAKASLKAARTRLAAHTSPGSPDQIVTSKWKWAERFLDDHRDRILAIPGVVGCGLGFRTKGGQRTSEPCITVLVRRKLKPTTLKTAGRRAIPRWLGSGRRRLKLDVIALGSVRRVAAAGDSVGRKNPKTRATVGALAVSVGSHAIVGITAMHAMRLLEFPAPGVPPVAVYVPSPVSQAGAPAVGLLERGSMHGIDVARFSMHPSPSLPASLPGIGPIRGWRPTVYPADRGTPVRIFGARSGFQAGFIVNPLVSLPADDLDAAILVEIWTEPGDSGCALIDPANLVLGFLVGEGTGGDGLRVFTPASLALARLGCDIPTMP